MLPAAFARGIGSDIQRPLATVVIGGLCMEPSRDALRALPAAYWLVRTVVEVALAVAPGRTIDVAPCSSGAPFRILVALVLDASVLAGFALTRTLKLDIVHDARRRGH